MVTIGPIAVPPLIEILQERTNAMRGMVNYTLGVMGPEADSAAPTVVPHLANPEARVQNQTANTLLQLGPQVVVVLANLSANGNAFAPYGVIAHSLILMLKQLATNSNATNRESAMEALVNLRPITSLSVKMLTNALADESASVRLAATRSLEKFGPKAAGALPEFERGLNDSNDSIRVAAKAAIEKISAAKSR